jgi:phage/plasmid-associated DNA primase
VKFKPTHKVLLPTNDKPLLPADDAFMGRTRIIPFPASFLGREDRTLEDRLERELPGILHKFIMACPDVIANGLQEPACVLDHTASYFQERDIARQFADDCLSVTKGCRVRAMDMEEAVGKWLVHQRRTGLLASSESHDAQLDTILQALAVRFPKSRFRDSAAGKDEEKGNVKTWWFTGCELKRTE